MTRILLLAATAISLVIPVATADAASRNKSKHYRQYHGAWQAPGYYGPHYYGGPRAYGGWNAPVYLRTPGPPEVCRPKTPLTYRNVEVYRIGPGGTFDLAKWRGTGGIAYTLSAEAGVLISSRGAVY